MTMPNHAPPKPAVAAEQPDEAAKISTSGVNESAPMDALIRWSIRHRAIVAALSVVWFCAGIFFALRAPLDVFPEFVPPQVTIQTEAPGFAPEQVETLLRGPSRRR